jgi:ArsR family transcriptional regulator, arsenate/arsenite/antimonite-responsive transcriptional repressor
MVLAGIGQWNGHMWIPSGFSPLCSARRRRRGNVIVPERKPQLAPAAEPLKSQSAVSALSALAHPSRLEVFRLLVRVGPEGMAAGEIARVTQSLPNTLSTNLGVLASAGLVSARRDGRSIIYAAGFDQMRELLAFLMEDCCGGNAEICAPLAAIAERAAACCLQEW